MKLIRVLLALVCVAAVAGVAYVSQALESSADKMIRNAERLVESLSKDQKAKALYAFDDKERINWHFVPLQEGKKPARKGLPLAEMSAEQRRAAMDLVRAGTSEDGFKKASAIMSLELILRELEKGGGAVRDPEWYFFTVFGAPAKTGRWGWRVEGHHLALNYVIDQGKIAAVTPTFFGCNPALIKSGDRKGERTLPESEDLARDLFKSLDAKQAEQAGRAKDFDEIEQAKAAPDLPAAAGITADKLSMAQQRTLEKLIQSYANRLPEDIALVEWNEVKEAGLGKVHFQYAGSTAEGKSHSYRVQGPTFVIEFLNVQSDSAGNPANHIHSCWRNIKGDFGIEVK